jgi:hypothetical protein
LYTLVKFSWAAVHTNKFCLSKSWHEYSFGIRLLGEENLSIFCRTHEQVKLSRKLACSSAALVPRHSRDLAQGADWPSYDMLIMTTILKTWVRTIIPGMAWRTYK